MKLEDFDPRIKDAIDDVMGYAGVTDDWIRLKKEIMRRLPPLLRTNFSTRDRKTCEQRMNDFERMVAEYWRAKTGIELRLIQLWERKDRVSR